MSHSPDNRSDLSIDRQALLDLLFQEEELGEASAQEIPRRQSKEPLQLSFAQQRLWFLDQWQHGSSTYNLTTVVRLTGLLNFAAFERSINEILRRHEALRTTFATVDGQPVQVVASPKAFALPVMSLQHLPETEREAEARRLVKDERSKPFDLVKGPLFRPSLLQLGEAEHILLLTMHHIVSDGWSMGILSRELTVLYEAFSAGHPSPLPELSIQYGDFAKWQREWLQGEVLERQLSYWKMQLGGIPTVNNVPIDRPRPAVQGYRGKAQYLELTKELTEGLKELSRKEGVTLFMTLLAAFQTLLYRYTSQEDIVVGSPIANRNRRDIEGLIGFFVNTLVLRTNVSGNPSFRELLGRARKTALDAYEHQVLPFEKLVEELQPERSLRYSPLFQVMFILQNAPNAGLEFQSLSVSPVRLDTETARFDLTLSIHETAPGLSGALQYNTDLFHDATITRMIGHFQILLKGIVADADLRISDLPILTEAEKHQLLVEWNDTKTDYPKDETLHQLFEARAMQSADGIAVICDEQQLTYAELNRRANQLAHYLLKDAGVRPGDLVGVCLERGFELIVALLGILKAGGAYVPLDPTYPKERLAFMLQDSGANVVTDEDSLGSLPAMSGRAICLDRDWKDIAKQPSFNPSSQSTADDLAYVIYTSGSTGLPKGVEVRHRGIARLLFGVDYAQLGATQTLLHLAPIFFDAATFEVWGALLHGGTCVLFPGKVPDAADLGTVLKKYRVSTLWLTAGLFNSVIDQRPQALSDVKQLLIGGEALSVPHVRKALEQLSNTQIINGYGPTESTTFTCCYPIPRTLGDDVTSIPLGRPIANTEIYILDDHLNLVPIGVAGELYIGGDGLARGYLNRPDLTMERFIANPFSTQTGARLYKTGDRARYLADGNLEFLGRLDDQVKIRGYRIELGEIEAVLAEHPRVRESIVIAGEGSAGDKRLVAYIVPRESAPTTNELRAHLKAKLPDYMVPSAFVFLDRLPLTSNGKVDHTALASQDHDVADSKKVYVAPGNASEQAIADIWVEILAVKRIGVHDNFFELGGHSLLATRVLNRLRSRLKVELSLRRMFEAPTIAELAEDVARMSEGGVK
jgi:amino acid adenylation domain-containing protein